MGPSRSGTKRALAALILLVTICLTPGAHADVAATPNVLLDQAADARIQVTPSGPFAPGQAVTVTPIGFAPNSFWIVALCPVGSRTTCGPSIGIGSGASPFVVRRTIYGAGVATNCSVVRCELAVLGTTVPAVPIQIDANAEITRPTVLVSPDDELADNQVVEIGGTGYSRYSEYSAVQCVGFTCSDRRQFLYSDDTGRLDPAQFRIQRTIGGIDCAAAPGTCTVLVSAGDHLDEFSAAALDFDPTRAPIPNPSATAAPSTGLVDGQTVALTISNTQSLPVVVRQCARDNLNRCRWNASIETESSDSVLTIDITVGRRVDTLDCATDACVLVIDTDMRASIVIPIGFDTAISPPPLPTISIEPSTGLADLQPVMLRLDGIDKFGYVTAFLCVGSDPQNRQCELLLDEPAPGPVFVAEFRLPRLINSARDLDCAFQTCEVLAYVYNDGSEIGLSHRVSFDSATPFAPPASARALPATGLWDRQIIEVRGTDFRTGSGVTIQQCAGTEPNEIATRCGSSRYVDRSAVATGTLSARTEVRRTFTTPAGETIDCLASGCSLVITTDNERIVVPIEFASTGIADAFPRQLECVTWPTSAWPVGDVPAGVDRSDLDAMARSATNDDTPYQSFVVIHGGEVVYEWYDAGTDAATIHPSFSVSKSFTSTIAGLLIGDGTLSLDGPAPVPEWSDPADPRHEISLRNLLNMSPGLEWDESYSFQADTDIIKMFASPDIGAYVANKPLVTPPGTEFRYSTGTTSLIARILAQQTAKRGPDFAELLFERLFTPLGISNVGLAFDSIGTWYGGSQTNLSTLDFAKLGLLYLRGGVWEDEQFLPEGWAEYVRTPSPAYPGYGAQFWLRDNGRFEMIGLFGQAVLIAPDLDLVVVSTNRAVSTDAIASLFESVRTPSCDGVSIVTDDAFTVFSSESTVLDVLANDPGHGESMAPDTLTIAAPPTNGTVAVVDGTVVYTSTSSADGSDAFTYVACNASRSCAEATADVTVTALFAEGASARQLAQRCSVSAC